MRTNLITALLAVGGMAILVARFHEGPWPPLRILGGVIMVIAVVLLGIARYQLGRSFSVTAQARQLVTIGLYTRVRNPIYCSGMLLFLGAALFVPSWWPIVILVVAIPLQIVRARKEAAVLRAAFGEQYEQYRKGTWF